MDKKIAKLWFDDSRIYVMTDGGETLSQPLEAYPALMCADRQQRESFYLWDNDHSARWEEIDEDVHISCFDEPATVDYNNEVNELLNRFPWLDMKAFAAYIGMHWTKLARFRYGVWTPSAATLEKIKSGIISIGKEMMKVAVL